MNETLKIKDNIARHIAFYSFDSVNRRARNLFKNDKVIFQNYDGKNDIWKFTVLGSQEYTVIIKGVNSLDIKHSCSCPYDWGTLCKHAAAALLYIAENPNKPSEIIEEVKVKQNEHRSGDNYGFEISDYKNITVSFVRRNSTELNLSRIYYNRELTNNILKITDTSVTFYSWDNKYKLKFYKENDKVFVTSTEAKNTDRLTLIETECLMMIALSPMPEFLYEVFTGTVIIKQKQFLERYGINNNNDFKKYFYYSFSQADGLTYVPFEQAEGLIPIDSSDNNSVEKLLGLTNNSDLVISRLQKKKEERELGFVLKKHPNHYYQKLEDKQQYQPDICWYDIIPIVGKPHKKDPDILGTYIKPYDKRMEDIFIINKSRNADELLNLLEAIEDDRRNFSLVRQAFDYLLYEKYVYKLSDNEYKIRKSSLQNISICSEPVDVVFEVNKDTQFISMQMKVKIGDKIFPERIRHSVPTENNFYTIGDKVHFPKDETVFNILVNYNGDIKMIAGFEEEFFRKVIEPVSKNYEVLFNDNTFKTNSVELDFHKKQLFLSEENEYIVFTPAVEYDNNVTALLYNSGNLLVNNNGTITVYKRNFELENEFFESLVDLHPEFTDQKRGRQFFLHYKSFMKDLWFYKFFDQLQALSVEVYGLKDLKNFRYSPFKGRIDTALTSGQDWFEVKVEVSFGNNKVSLNDLRKAAINKQRYIQLKDGSVGILPSEWYHKLERYFRNGEIDNDKVQISKLRFSMVDQLFENIEDEVVLEEIADKKRRLKSFTNIKDTEVPEQINANLRHYQKEGLNWLNFLDEMQWGGILADDMGLGKTLQVLAFMQQQANKNKGVNLIIVPTTLLFNWQNELCKFATCLKALFYYGVDRSKNTDEFEKYDLVITTYGILVRDIELLSQFSFNYVVLDESQAIKNPLSHRYKAACLLKARNRITLTGTPIENSTFDLYAQMNFANRGFLGTMQKFREDYSIPIDKEGNESIAGELNKIVHPFILRRTKEKVALELPDKTEDVIFCEMESAQRRIYDAYRNEYRNKLLNKIEEEGIEKSKLMVLEALTRLRQICDSPALLNSDDIAETQSVKIQELVRHITNKTGKHKILIFSQFVKMLGLLRDELAKLNIEYEYLDGQCSSRQREVSVNNFQENESLRVFLISLKAGGTGLNLTAADYVYIVDPWWNPAVESQAIDRCHRIGQDKKVFAYRMICKNTVEEKILDLQNKKKKIAGDIIQTDESIMKKLDHNDIHELFS